MSDYAAARSWAAELSGAAGHYRLETVEVGRNTIGSNRLPAAAVFETAEEEIAFAGKSRESARLRELVHPHVESVLMDEETLLAHRDAWGKEPSPSRAALTRLTPEEAALYQALRDDRFGSAVRLEQELIGWDWALERLQ